MRVHDVTYHRNGVGGEGFFTVTFTPDGHKTALIGISWGDDDSESRCGVIDPRDTKARFRGADEWGQEILAAIAEWTENGKAFEYGPDPNGT